MKVDTKLPRSIANRARAIKLSKEEVENLQVWVSYSRSLKKDRCPFTLMTKKSAPIVCERTCFRLFAGFLGSECKCKEILWRFTCPCSSLCLYQDQIIEAAKRVLRGNQG